MHLDESIFGSELKRRLQRREKEAKKAAAAANSTQAKAPAADNSVKEDDLPPNVSLNEFSTQTRLKHVLRSFTMKIAQGRFRNCARPKTSTRTLINFMFPSLYQTSLKLMMALNLEKS